jgi:DNA-directed RNA polymerase subunit F
VWEELGGDANEKFGEYGSINRVGRACAARASKGFNGSDKPIDLTGVEGDYYTAKDKDQNEIIVRAREMLDYISKTGNTDKAKNEPDKIIETEDELVWFQSDLNKDDVAIMVGVKPNGEGHVGVIQQDYNDPHVKDYLGPVYKLPTEDCKCP